MASTCNSRKKKKPSDGKVIVKSLSANKCTAGVLLKEDPSRGGKPALSGLPAVDCSLLPSHLVVQ